MSITDAHRRYLVLDQGIGAVLLNVAFNAGFAWVAFQSFEMVPLWGDPSVIADTVGMTLILPFATCLVVTRLVHREIRKGRFGAPEWRRHEHPILGRLPKKTFPRALVFAFVSLAVFLPPTIGVFAALGVAALPFSTFLIFKSIYAGVLAGVVAPAVALSALGDA